MNTASTHKMALRLAALAAVLAMLSALLVACSGQSATESAQETANRQYMSQVNQVMEDLQASLEDFTDAVSRDDVVAMQTQAENALAVLDELESIEAPEDLSDVHQCYVEGADLLRQALNDYVSLYIEISSASDDNPFDWSSYEERLEQIQSTYDEGIAKLQEGDSLAAGEEGTSSTSSSSSSSNSSDDSQSQDEEEEAEASDTEADSSDAQDEDESDTSAEDDTSSDSGSESDDAA